jgi:hypothetical protein
MAYTRANPSPRYRELQRMYVQMHEEGAAQQGIAPEHTFNGMSLLPQAARIKRLIERTDASTILDYGSGKGSQYDPRPVKAPDGSVHESMVDYWDVTAVQCYDPCYAPYSTLPQGRFDGVICTDVLEHCPEEDIPWILGEIFGYAERFVYANVACYPASKVLPNGENAHCTIKPVAWWRELILAASAGRPELIWEVWVHTLLDTDNGMRIAEEQIRVD